MTDNTLMSAADMDNRYPPRDPRSLATKPLRSRVLRILVTMASGIL